MASREIGLHIMAGIERCFIVQGKDYRGGVRADHSALCQYLLRFFSSVKAGGGKKGLGHGSSSFSSFRVSKLLVSHATRLDQRCPKDEEKS